MRAGHHRLFARDVDLHHALVVRAGVSGHIFKHARTLVFGAVGTGFGVHGEKPHFPSGFNSHIGHAETPFNGKIVHHVGIPLHWGFKGVAKNGFITNTLTPFVGDGNTQTPEFKSFLVNIEKLEGGPMALQSLDI